MKPVAILGKSIGQAVDQTSDSSEDRNTTNGALWLGKYSIKALSFLWIFQRTFFPGFVESPEYLYGVNEWKAMSH